MARLKSAKRPARRRPDLWLLARHDFHQPAQSLDWLAHGLAGACSDEERHRATALIAQVAATLQQMVAGMTLVAKLEANLEAKFEAGEPQTPATVSLSAIVDAAIEEVAGLAAHRRLSVTVRRVAAQAVGAEALVSPIVRGMLLYALKHALDGEISVGADTSAQTVALHVTFRGIHQATALMEAAFVDIPPIGANGKPFVGLGPALMARVAEGIGGGLALDELVGGRARVTLTLAAAAK